MIDYEGRSSDRHDRDHPQDRQREALVMNWSLVENTLLGRQHRKQARRGLELDRGRARSEALAIREHLDIRAASVDMPVKNALRGNQQKLVVGVR